ncbi:MAG TPA: proton-conducting transporter membrane subunit, partial [Terriglobales bacterium]|nr:proton-conducting transporter membrane subunit [Terriglobales bacterium]
GLFWQRPVLASVLTVALLSLAGIPATMGFVSKFYVLAAGAGASAWSLILILAITSVAGLFYYLRIVVALYSAPPELAFVRVTSKSGVVVVAALSILLIWFGVYPASLFKLVHTTVAPRDARDASFVTRTNE